jgi:hypothetical protein
MTDTPIPDPIVDYDAWVSWRDSDAYLEYQKAHEMSEKDREQNTSDSVEEENSDALEVQEVE